MNSSESIEMYLKSLAELGGDQAPVAVARLAERMNVTQVSAGEMMKRLGERSLVHHLPYKGVCLTEDGCRLANNVIRRQRLWECFLVERLELAWERSYEIACSLEHATEPEVTEALARYLDYPSFCPHGNPIPDASGRAPSLQGQPLNSLSVGQSARVVAIYPESSEALTYLGQRYLTPGQTFTLIEIAPMNGPLILLVKGKEVAVGEALAALILVEDDDEE